MMICLFFGITWRFIYLRVELLLWKAQNTATKANKTCLAENNVCTDSHGSTGNKNGGVFFFPLEACILALQSTLMFLITKTF